MRKTLKFDVDPLSLETSRGFRNMIKDLASLQYKSAKVNSKNITVKIYLWFSKDRAQLFPNIEERIYKRADQVMYGLEGLVYDSVSSISNAVKFIKPATKGKIEIELNFPVTKTK